MNQRLQNQRRSSITVDRPYTVLFPSTTSIPPNLETNDFDDYMDSSDSLTSISSEPAQPDRPVTRSFTKMQNAQLNSVTPRTLTTQAISSSLRSLETQLHQTVRGSKINSKSLKPPPPPQTYQKIQIDEKSVNLVSILEKSMLTGKRPNSMTTLPDTTLRLLSQRLQNHDYPFLIKRLSQLSVTLNFRNNSREFYELMKVLGEIENRLVYYEPDPAVTNSQFREEFEVETINVESARIFRQYGGIEIFKRILLMSLLVSEKADPSSEESKFSIRSLSNAINESATPLRRKNKFLLTDDSNQTLPPAHVIVENYSILKIKCKCIHILNRLVCLPKFGKIVVNDLLVVQNNNSEPTYDTILLQYLFSLLMFKDSRLLSCQLIESILLHMPMLNLNRICNIKYILETIDDEGLAAICRISAITLSDLDITEKKYWSNLVEKRKKFQQDNASVDPTVSEPEKPVLTIRDQNQELLLNIPNLLSRLVGLVRRKDYAVRYQGVDNELEHWMRYLDEALSDSEENESTNLTASNELEQMMLDNRYRTNTQSSPSNDLNNNLTNYRSGAPENQLYQPALLAASKLNNFVHVLYTLSLLLIGKERKNVQKTLAKLRLAPALNSLFDYLVWHCRCEYHSANTVGNAEQQQQRSHICPEVAVKIQFLRLVHSFCDHSEYRRVVLSRDEIEEIIRYNREAHACFQVPESTLKIDTRISCTKEKVGLLSKIAGVIKQEPFSASFRFWLTRAIESFLRGGTSYADQLFLINRGILEDTLQNILTVNFTRPKEVVQSCFDMLGELIKFNNTGFMILNRELAENEKFNMLIRMINQSLVDSNMFLRSIFLSIEFFEDHSEVIESELETNQILCYFSSFERRIGLLCKMINTINLHNLSQENVSCLNTTLVVLILANRREKLPQYLEALHQKSTQSIQTPSTSTSSMNQQIDTLTNLKDLLLFWLGHYLQKDKDCVGLEQNSHIEFTHWKQTVELLLNTDEDNKCSLNYYMKKDSENLKNKSNQIAEYRGD